jgi:hypothetical protein
MLPPTDSLQRKLLYLISRQESEKRTLNGTNVEQLENRGARLNCAGCELMC